MCQVWLFSPPQSDDDNQEQRLIQWKLTWRSGSRPKSTVLASQYDTHHSALVFTYELAGFKARTHPNKRPACSVVWVLLQQVLNQPMTKKCFGWDNTLMQLLGNGNRWPHPWTFNQSDDHFQRVQFLLLVDEYHYITVFWTNTKIQATNCLFR